ncbi:hypothetical protein FEM48_Zijuj05G0136000 [Ziziphus jujuba var. spinosa]|uniref:Uncharacterized protein n=1 Tax=Ziziphus jujuba var. spinosa TaxID=714518 RepID=A0A978VF51_ZIZJJ|nr:hypothetical protein FEM48_Zijuj05G0136000 [Ziziphus jujuba var. spinosa]
MGTKLLSVRGTLSGQMRNRLLYRLFITMRIVNTIMPEVPHGYHAHVAAVPSLSIGANTSNTRSTTSGAAAGVEAWEEERVYEACRHQV